MLKNRFSWNLFVGYALLVAVTTAVLGVVGFREIRAAVARSEEDTLRGTVGLLRDLLAGLPAGEDPVRPLDPGPGPERPQEPPSGPGALVIPSRVLEVIRQVVAPTDTRILVSRPDGTLVADTSAAGREPAGDSRLPEHLRLAELGGGGHIISGEDPEGRSARILALPVLSDHGVRGQVTGIRPRGPGRNGPDTPGLAFLLGCLVVLSLSLLAGLAAISRASGAFDRMDRVVEVVAAGNLTSPGLARLEEEMGSLGSNLTTIAGQLRERLELVVQEREKLSQILENLRDGVVALDRDGRIMHWNEAASRLMGCDREELAGGSFRDLAVRGRIPAGVVSQLESQLELDAGATAPVPQDLRVEIGPSGDLVEIRFSPIPAGTIGAGGVVLLLHDLTPMRQLEVMRERFVADASHEMRTPVTAIQALLEPLIEDGSMPADTRQRFLGKIQIQLVRLARLSENLLVLSRLDWASTSCLPVAVDLGEAIEEAVRTLAGRVASRGQRLEVRLPAEPVLVSGNADDAVRVVENLLDNAIKYTPDGGHIRIEVLVTGRDAVLEVEDTGIGIEPADRDHIFDRFFRVDRERSRDHGGTGLGLAIVRRVVERSGGQVELESRPGAGSTFRIRWPASGPDPSAGALDEPDPRPDRA